jgi:hypothetical protein
MTVPRKRRQPLSWWWDILSFSHEIAIKLPGMAGNGTKETGSLERTTSRARIVQ